MTCSEDRLVAFLAGELSAGEAREFDEHLLGCEACWRSVQDDRVARLALARLREPAPDGLSDRIALLVDMSPDRPAEASRFGEAPSWKRARGGPSKALRRRLLPAAIGPVAASGLAIGLVVATGSSPGMPAQVAAVAAVAEPMSSASTAPDQRRMTVDGETMRVRFFVVDHVVVTVATARSPFPMVSSSDLEKGSTSRSWLATVGDLGAFCMNRGGRGESMLVVAKMPAAELPALAVRLHLI
ncbi:MAG: zf-HC2 domain-containing protein [Acidimicrobiales bacterium]